MHRRPFKSFASRLSLYIILLTTAIFVCIAAVSGYYSAKSANKNVVLYSSALLKTILNDTELELNDVEHIVDIIDTQVDENISNTSFLWQLLTDMISKENIIMGGSVALDPQYCPKGSNRFMIYVYRDEKGNIRRKNLGNEDYEYLNSEWYLAAKNSEKPIWADPYIDTGGGNRLMTTYSKPLIDDTGKVYGVVTADVSIQEFVALVDDMHPNAKGFTFIINSKGAYISHPDSNVVLNKNIFSRAHDLKSAKLEEIGKRMIAQETGSTPIRTSNDLLLACYAPLEKTGWSACYLCPYSTILDEMGRFSVYVYPILFLGFCLLILCIRRIILRQTKPMKQLTNAVYNMSSGDFDQPLPTINTEDELQQLLEGFKYMQSSLKGYIAQLTEATRAKERIASELSIAHDIQLSLLPHNFSIVEAYPNVDINALLNTAKEVGGDFYDFLFRDDKLYFTIADVSGKGVPAALVMATTHSLFRALCDRSSSPAEIVSVLNNSLAVENDSLMFVTLFVGVLDLKSNKLCFCNAGHNPPVLIQSDGKPKLMKVEANLPIGIEPNMQYIEQSLQLTTNTMILLYTDGVTEAKREDNTQFGEERLLKELSAGSELTSAMMVKRIQESVIAFVDGAEASDDLTLLAVKITDIKL